LFAEGKLTFCYAHYDRIIFGGVVPISMPLVLEAIKPTGTKEFLDRAAN
jgi:4-deoxy-L-threo-5-hexosulose-uronate ketol-isomerase